MVGRECSHVIGISKYSHVTLLDGNSKSRERLFILRDILSGFLFGPSVEVHRDYNGLLQSHNFTPSIVYRDPGLVTSLDITHTMSTSNGILPPSLNLPVWNGFSRTDSAAKIE